MKQLWVVAFLCFVSGCSLTGGKTQWWSDDTKTCQKASAIDASQVQAIRVEDNNLMVRGKKIKPPYGVMRGGFFITDAGIVKRLIASLRTAGRMNYEGPYTDPGPPRLIEVILKAAVGSKPQVVQFELGADETDTHGDYQRIMQEITY